MKTRVKRISLKKINFQIIVCCIVSIAILALVPGTTIKASSSFGTPAFFKLECRQPFEQPKDKSDPLQAGDVAITVYDRDRVRLSTQLVFLIVRAGSPLDNILTNDRYEFKGFHQDYLIKDIWQHIQKEYNARPVALLYTGDDGVADWNYFINLSINIDNFLDKIKKGKIEGNIEVLCVSRGYVIECEEQIPVIFPGVARIEIVQWLNEDKDGKPSVTVERPLWDMSRPHKTIVTKDMVKKEPYYLYPGEKIVLEQDDWVRVTWLTGVRIKARPKSTVPKATLEIAGEGTTWWIEAVKKAELMIAGFTLSGASLLLNVVALTGSAAAGGFGIAVSLVGFVVAGAGILEHKYNPLFLEIYSNVLMDINGETGEVTAHLVEGNCILTEELGNPGTKITTGQQVTLDKEGNAGAVSEFSLDTLDNNLISLMEEGDEGVTSLPEGEKETQVPEATQGIIDEKETQGPATIKGLTFESRSKPNASEVWIPLSLSGISQQMGNLDLTLTYDPDVLEAVEVTGGSLTLDSIMEYNITPGNIKIALADSEGFPGDGTVVYIKFNVIGSQGQTSPLTITRVSANGADYELIHLSSNDGVFSVTGIDEAQGDYDGNGRLTAVDALYALQMAVGKRPVDLSLDMNDDGQVTSLDARTILKIAVGK